MRKFIASVVVGIGLLASLTACNKQVIDLTYSYSWAQFKMPDGSIVEGKLDSWKDYDGEQIQVTIDGTRLIWGQEILQLRVLSSRPFIQTLNIDTK